MATRVTLTSRIPAIVAAANAKAQLVIEKTAADIEAGAKTRAPVDTGYLKSSIEHHKAGDLSAEVTVGAEYGPYLEYGTKRAPAQPYLVPAAEEARPGFEQAMSQVYK